METKLVLDADGVIVNRIVVDETTPVDWSPGEGLELADDDPVAWFPWHADIGGSLVDGVYTPPSEQEPAPGDSPPQTSA